MLVQEPGGQDIHDCRIPAFENAGFRLSAGRGPQSRRSGEPGFTEHHWWSRGSSKRTVVHL